MIDLSLAGLLGAFVGTVVAAVTYAPLVGIRRAPLAGARSVAERRGARDVRAARSSLLRRIVLAIDIVVFAGLGYWLGALADSGG